jgi:PAS domain S-box-containing protein
MAIVQDNDGFMWFGTQAGVNRYDGYSIKVHNADERDTTTISSALINALFIDHQGQLWIGTEFGLNRFDFGKETFVYYFHDPQNIGTLSNSRILSLCEDRKGNLWIGTDNGLNRFDQKNNHFERLLLSDAGTGNNSVRALCVSRSGVLWVGVYGKGVYRYDYLTSKFFQHVHDTNNNRSLSNNNILSICEDAYGMMWIGTEKGLNKFDPKRESFTRYLQDTKNTRSLSSNNITALLAEKNGDLWIGTYNGGLNYYDSKTNSFIQYQHDPYFPYSLIGTRIPSLYKSKNGELWIGTFNKGVNVYSKEMQRFVHYKNIPYNPNSLNSNRIRPIYADDSGFVWVGTDGGGLNKFDRNNNRFIHYTHNPRNPYSISSNRVFAICEDNADIMWIGTNGGGLNKFNRRTQRFLRYKHNPKDSLSLSNDNVRCVIKGEGNILWVGTVGGGLNKFNKKTKQFTHYRFDPEDPFSLGNDRIFRLYIDRSGVLWVGTFGGGLNKFDEEKNQFIRYQAIPNDSTTLNDNFILAIYEDLSGTFWVGKTSGGLSKFDRNNNTFTHYTPEDGLPDNIVYDILEDNSGNLWLSTNQGIARFNPEKGAVKKYDIRDGLQSNEFNTGTGFISKSGEMFLGGINGFNSFFPHEIKDNIYPPSIVITGFQLFNKTVPIGQMDDGRTILNKSIIKTDEIVLSYADKVFSFEFSALHYVFPKRNRYAYKMEGFEENWNYIGNRRYATYTALPPGRYVFKVRGANSDGLWNETGSTIKIIITPPFWKKWWFYALCILCAMLLIASAFFYLLLRSKRKREEKVRRRVTETFSQALSQGHAAVYRSNYNTNKYDFMSYSIEEITGYTSDEITPSTWRDIIISIENKGELAGLSFDDAFNRIKSGAVNFWLSDAQIKTKSGTIRWVMDMATVLRDENGHPFGCLGIFFDITERKLVEEQLREKRAETEKDLSMARELQMALLSHNYSKFFPTNVTKAKSAIRFFYRYLPASALSGDFFEIIPISDYQIGLLIYDVVGHGVRASLLTAYLHGLVDKLLPVASDTKTFIKGLNTNINEVVYQHFAGTFITAFYLVADLKHGSVTYTNAGHPIPFILQKKKSALERLCQSQVTVDPPLGVFSEFDYSGYTSKMVNGDTILFYTDGLYEVMDDNGNMYGSERLCNYIQKCINEKQDSLLDGIIDEIKKFSGREVFKDDICMVAMQVKKAKIEEINN